MKDTLLSRSVLFAPLLIAFLWMGLLVLNAGSPDASQKLSPTKLDYIVNVLFVFIIVYSGVLAVVFYNMKHKRIHKIIHK
ncbi:hypothetical protein J4401_02490 [Candidatus Woesearchaeota archaeon]|nr:hypothetical protein [Candidatus Woesearchaeota archaeon]